MLESFGREQDVRKKRETIDKAMSGVRRGRNKMGIEICIFIETKSKGEELLRGVCEQEGGVARIKPQA